jgi:5-deoxy-glucuronate isomerase
VSTIHRRGSLGRGAWESVVDDSLPGWQHTGIRIAELAPDGSLTLDVGAERIVVPLSGAFTVAHDGTETVLAGRSSPFSGPTDVLYLSTASAAVITGSGRLAVAESPTGEVHPTRYIAAADVPVEERGAGASRRIVTNFGTPQALDAAHLIVCEVLTPAGNWSSYPAHKHDEDIPGHESRLEEIYYFEAAGGADAAEPFGLFVAGELATAVRTGDIALVPDGYHGPAAAAPGYDLYYLNVMAGPGRREWLITDDPRQAWIRETWTEGVTP